MTDVKVLDKIIEFTKYIADYDTEGVVFTNRDGWESCYNESPETAYAIIESYGRFVRTDEAEQMFTETLDAIWG